MRTKFLLLGFGFGLCFPLIGLLTDCFLFNDLPFSLNVIGNRMLENPIHFIILSAPIVLGVTFFFIGKSNEKREILNTQLEKKNAEMKTNNELLDTFNYHVSHDLKTLLNNQVTLSKMMMKYAQKGDLEKSNEIAIKIKEAGENGLTTVHSFLEISQEGFIADSQGIVSIDVPNEIARIIEENGLKDKVLMRIEEMDFNKIKIGSKVFESIVLNLVTNSIKYNDNEPEVTIHLKKTKKSKQLIFADNGIGIDLEKERDNLFQPFNRIENNKKTEGTGIGLYLIFKMVNSLGGQIEVKSQLKKGTEFTLTFPL